MSLVPSPVGMISDDLMSYLSICARITVFLLLWSPYAICPLCVAFVHCGQTVGVRVGFGPVHFVLDGDFPKALRLEFRNWTGALPVVAGFVALE